MSIENHPTYVIRFCGVSDGNPGTAGAGVLLCAEDRTVLYRFRLGLGEKTDNAAEYIALILGMNRAINKGYKNIIAETHRPRIVLQVLGFEYAHKPIRRLWRQVLDLKERFHSFHIQRIPSGEILLADAQANQAVNLEEELMDLKHFVEGELQEDDASA